MPHPLLLEINTRCRLRALSDQLGRPVTLAGAPETEIAAWKERGFTHVWLMGVWGTGPKTLGLARAQPGLQALSAKAFGTRARENLLSSPYAVADYTVAEALGGAAGLRRFRSQLHRHGLGLVLDFIPNHLGLDHRWLEERNGLFVRGPAPAADAFPVVHGGATSWVAHGRDPNFPAWIDTAQLDYRLAPTRAAMLKTLLFVASQCDGARCDMAMLLLNDVFANVWSRWPSRVPAPPEEFWAGAISAVKQRRPQFMFMAEAYWDLEPRLGALGFDYVYDKTFLDLVARRDYAALQSHLRAAQGRYRPARFLENHDEPRIASRLSEPEQKAAAALLLAQPGLRLLHDGQRAGRQRHTPVQFARYWPESGNPETAAFYDHLLSSLRGTAVGSGEMEFCETGLPHCFAMKWNQDTGRADLMAVNLSPERARFQIPEWKGRQIDLAAFGFELLQWPAVAV